MKKNYNQPEVLVAQITMGAVVLAGSVTPAPPSGDMNMNYDIPTNDQW